MTRPGWRSSSVTQSENRTVFRRCCAQYSGSVASAAVIHVPVKLDRYGICGGRSVTRRICAMNDPSIGSIIEE